ncbi:MAG: ATP-binding cassette domain-containing protein [Candidatus Nanoarchaeia archaeon]|jgi:ABC-2 type transport system ATP-binding protein
MKEPIISVNCLKKTFRKHEREAGVGQALKSLFKRHHVTVKAVKDVSFDVQPGDILGYLGPNGAGKSTVIKMLTGILYPTSGEIKSMDYNPWRDREEYVANIGVVFGQKSNLWFDLPAIDSFRLQKTIYEIPDKDFNKRLDEMTKLLNVKDISKTPVRNLSLGERMRCEFIACMLHDPKLLFLDEPTIGLDLVAKERIRDFIKKANKERGTTVILTTHDVGDVEELCNRIIIIDKGSHIYEGSLAELKKKYVDHKLLQVEFNKKVKSPRLKNCKLVDLPNEQTAVFKVNLSKTGMTKAVQEAFSKYDVYDIDIKEQSVESIIRQIYGENA